MSDNVFKVKRVTDGQDFVVADFGGRFVEKVIPMRVHKAATRTATVPDGQTYNFEIFNIDVKDAVAVAIVVSSPQDLSYNEENNVTRASVSWTLDYFTDSGVLVERQSDSGYSFFKETPINPNRSIKSSYVVYSICDAFVNELDVKVSLINSSGVDAEVTVDVYVLYDLNYALYDSKLY